MTNTADKIRTLRRDRAMTQDDLVARSGLSVATIQRAERGERLSADSIASIAAAFGIDPTDLANADEETFDPYLPLEPIDTGRKLVRLLRLAARIGTIRRIQQRGAEFRVIFEFDETMPSLTVEQIAEIKWDLQLDDFEFSRTHWAVKDGDLHAILREHGLLPAPEPQDQAAPPSIAPAVEVVPAKVFLVHGRDEAAKHAVARFLERRVGLDVVILSERPNRGRSILTKFQQEADGAAFVVVLMTGDDLGKLRPNLAPDGSEKSPPTLRPRQNVIFEMGFFIGRLGVERVCALVSPNVERPSDYDGIVYLQLDDQDGWQHKLVTELQAANVPVSPTWWKR